jgi:hypothetical protein
MNKPTFQLLGVVALNKDAPALKLLRGQMGTVVEIFEDGGVDVEFADEAGRTFAQGAFDPMHLMKLHYRPAKVA